MKRKILMSLVLATVLAVAYSSVSVQATNGGLVQLGLCIDGSGSISSGDFTLMIDGIAEAIRNNLPHDGSVELCVIQFASYGPAVVEIPPTVIDSSGTAETVATAVEGITQLYEFTSMADGLWLTWDTMKASPNFNPADKQIINLATDGEPNRLLSLAPGSTGNAYEDVELVVGWAVAEGLDELDAEAITTAPDVPWLRDMVVYPVGYEAPTLNPNPYDFDGDGIYDPGWVRQVDTFEEFANTIGEKFEVIVPPEEHDVAAVSQTVAENEVLPGTVVDIDVTVTNLGQFTETFDLTCYYDSVEIGTILVVDLAPGESRVVTFTWDTTGMPMNGYAIRAWADSGEAIVEVDEDNNWCDMPLPIFVIPEVPIGTILTVLSMLIAFAGFVGFKRFRPKL